MKVLLAIFMICFHLVAQAQNEGNKISGNLKLSLQKKSPADSIKVSFWVKPDIKISALKINTAFQPAPQLLVGKVRVKDIAELLLVNEIVFINEVLPAKEELNTGAVDYTLNNIHYVHYKFPQLQANGLKVIIKERKFDTTDIDLIDRTFITGGEDNNFTSHAGLMATIVAGAGNSSPATQGAAQSATVGSVSFLNLFPETDSFYKKQLVAVQNHSYGTVVENFYGNEAAAYDASAINNPSLLHIFSAGNSGSATTTGAYANVPGVANLSGNFKQAKNIITVSATDSSGQVLPLSSKGPAFDGRVKPELVAYGEDGSSGAAALVSGAALLVADAYKNVFSTLPPAHVTKAILLNSADDVGVANIDYQSGYGSLNAYKAVETVIKNNFITGTVSQNETKVFPLTIPAGIRKLKLTVTWNDPAVLPGTTKLLVNDIDANISYQPTAQTWLPWTLNPFPHKDSLALPAVRGRDSLNNVEQISIDNPIAGTYEFKVHGRNINTIAQTFAIAYSTDSAQQFFFTYPTAVHPLTGGKKHRIRWTTTATGAATIEYATNGINWRLIADLPDISVKEFTWSVPDTVTTAVLRMRFAAIPQILTSDTFAISPGLIMKTGFNCADSFLLHWNSIPAQRYQLYALGAKKLLPFAQTTDTAIVLRKNVQPAIYFAAAPVIGNRFGLRSNTINYQAGGVGCYVRGFFLQTQTTSEAVFSAQFGSLFNVTEISFQKIVGGSFVDLQKINSPTLLNYLFTDPVLRAGDNVYRLQIKLSNGALVYSEKETVFHSGNSSPVFVYPNPVLQNGGVKIIANESGRYKVRMFDITGRQIHRSPLNSIVSNIQTTAWAKGMYVVVISDSNRIILREKLVVQ